MTLPLPWDFRSEKPDGSKIQDSLDELALQFPVGATNLVGSLQGTTLPTSPVNGQDYYYVADSTNGVVWHLKYRSASGSSYKWEYVGGAPLLSEVDTTNTSASLTYVALAAAGPTVTVPLAGDYIVSLGMRSQNTGSPFVSLMSFDVGATGALDADAAVAGSPQGGGWGVNVSVARDRR
jgi:hypothetical protein